MFCGMMKRHHIILLVQWFFFTSLILFVLIQLGILNRAPAGLTAFEKAVVIFEAVVGIQFLYLVLFALCYGPGFVSKKLGFD